MEISSRSVAGIAKQCAPDWEVPLSSHSACSRVEVAGQGLTGLPSPEDVKQGLSCGSLLASAALRTILAFVSGIGCHVLCLFCSCNVPTSSSSSSCSFLFPVPIFLLCSPGWFSINIFLPQPLKFQDCRHVQACQTRTCDLSPLIKN